MKSYVVISLGEILKYYDESKITDAFKKFSCQREHDLENFLLNKAITYEKTDIGKTYLCLDQELLEINDEFRVMAYFTIAMNAIDLSALSGKKKRKILGNYPGRDGINTISTYLIGQLGRCDDYTTEDLSGEQLLDECYHAISLAAKVIGGRIIILECRECMYDKFYQKHGFQDLYNGVKDNDLYTLFKKINFKEYWD